MGLWACPNEKENGSQGHPPSVAETVEAGRLWVATLISPTTFHVVVALDPGLLHELPFELHSL